MLPAKPMTRRRLFYPVGMISLAFLPILYTGFILEHPALQPMYLMEIYYPDKNDSVPKMLANRAIVSTIIFEGDLTDKAKLDDAHLAIRELLRDADTTLGLKFVFGPHAKYATFVALLNLCKKEEAHLYFNEGNRLWVLNCFPKDSSQMVTCGFGSHSTCKDL